VRPDFGLILSNRQTFSTIGAVGTALKSVPVSEKNPDDMAARVVRRKQT
jgi:hypothetical protein